MNPHPIIIVDDDDNHLESTMKAFEELKIKNEIIIFDNGFKFLQYMWTTERKTFFIFCNVNLGIINGLDLQRKISEDSRLRLKCTPFLLSSTMKASESIIEAYSFHVHGYFVKPNTIKEYAEMLKAIMVYWNFSHNPNS